MTIDSYWLKHDQQNHEEDQNTNEETGLVQRVRFGVINGSKNCTKTQSRACKIQLDPSVFQLSYSLPADYCSLPVELGCSGTYKLLGMSDESNLNIQFEYSR